MPIEILPGIHQIVLPTPFPVGPVNCYLSCSSPVTLVDTGVRWEESQKQLCNELDCLGMTLRDIQRIIITHPHPDHYGLAAEIVRQSEAELWTHRYSMPVLSPTEQSKETSRLFYQQLFTECGVPQSQTVEFFQSREKGSPFTEPVQTHQTLDEGDLVELGGDHWVVLHTPGHSGALICLYHPEKRVLLANDHLLRSISSNAIVEPDNDGGPRPHRLVQYLFHLQRMADLNPQVAWTGHGAEIHDVEKVVRQRIRFHHRRADYILELLNQQELTAFEITLSIFGTRSGFDAFLSLSETIGHMDWLHEQRRIRSENRDGVDYWTRLGN